MDARTKGTTGPAPVQPDRVIADLKEIARLTGGPGGARRVCWTDEWAKARNWLRGALADLPVQVEIDLAGNLWATLPGQRTDRVVVVGSHIDSVPQGGWLDGALGVTSALEVLRQYTGTMPPVTLRLVDWADEEGARFGRSLLGSSAAAGTLDIEKVRGLHDRDGIGLPDALATHGVVLEHMQDAGAQLANIRAYLELHIEQGPVLEQLGLPIGTVLGTFGVERHAIHFTGKACHAGATPIHLRNDPFLSAARLALDVRETARRFKTVATVGTVTVTPGVVTAVPGTCTITLDQRALDAEVLATMLHEAREASERIAAEEGTTVRWEQVWHIEPIPFHPTLIEFAAQACQDVSGSTHRLPSGPLHDAAEMARLFPTVMLFSSSTGGVSHTPVEDTPIEHLHLAIRAYAHLAARTLEWVATSTS